MPIIAAYADHPTRPYVRVEINWADVPAASHAGVYRVNVATGECVPLRPYICYSGWELLLSCGHGTFWDTEAPFDTAFYYVTTSSEAPCIPAETVVSDIFNRVLVDSWGSADTGQPYTLSGGTNPGDYDVTDGFGTHNLTTVNTRRHSFLFTGQTDQNAYVDCSIPVASATGAGITQWLLVRLTDVSNWYCARLELSTAGAMTLILAKRVAGVVSDIGAAVAVGTGHTANELWRIRVSIVGSALKAKAWPVADAEPSAWQLEATDTDLPAGDGVGMADRLETGSGNAPLVSSWDNLFVGADPCTPCTPVSVDTSSTPITLANDGGFWLKDPVRPCNDRPVPLCQASGVPECGADGILFVGIGPEVYASNSFSLRPMNRRRTIAVTRPRGDATTALRLQTLTFAARDELLELVAPGTPLLFQGPSEYGIPDRYMDIRDVQVSPELSDLRIQIRSETLPYNTVDRPAGPTQGICGTRVADICDLHPTWDALAATGFTWDDLVRGAADPAIANPLRRTWDDVQAEFADWDAVEAGGRTWTGLLEGE